jgi:lipopolysaccharide biosynthesis regulator YciM
LVDYYILKSDYAHANGCIDRLDKAIGGDPYLNVLRAGLGAVTSDFKAAREFVDRALKEEPGLVPGYFALLDISLQEKTYKEALDLLKTLDQTFKIKFSDLATEPDYAGCVKSPQYQEWLKYLAQKAAKQKASPTKTPADTQKTPPSKTADSAT